MTFSIPDRELRWLYVDFNSYFASVEQQLRPELRGRPVAVIPVETDATCAIAASYEAKAYGVKTGTPIWQAKTMCPGLVCIHAKHERYVDFHHRIQAEINNHIPISAVCSIDEVACRLMKNEASMQVSTRIALSIKSGLKKNIGEYIRCSIGIAPNKYLAKVATDIQKPDGLTVLESHSIAEQLTKLSLRDLPGVGINMERRLWNAGIYDMEALLRLAPKQMRAVWGSVWGERMWYMLRGVEVPEEETTRGSIGHSHVMAPELRAPTQARHVARRLTLKAASRLRRMEYYASLFHLSVRGVEGERLSAEARCVRAQDNFTFLQMLDALWLEVLKNKPRISLKKISVTLHGLVRVDEAQPDLFDSLDASFFRSRKNAERLSHAMDALNQRYGRDTVLIGILPSQGRSFSGTKVAFTRIPDREEFEE